MYIIGALVPMVMGIIFSLYSYSLYLGRLGDPGPGLWPFALSGIMTLASVFLFLTERNSNDYEKFTDKTRSVVYACLSMAAFIFLFDKIGLVLCGVLILIFWLKVLAKEPWRITVPVTIGVVALIYLVFVVWLKIPIPEASLFGR